jgi:effector-binding domain-containing protein
MDLLRGLVNFLRRYRLLAALVFLLIVIAIIIFEYKFLSKFPSTEVSSDSAKSTLRNEEGKKEESSSVMQPRNKDSGSTPAQDSVAAAVISQAVMIDARPAVVLRGQGKWQDSAKIIFQAQSRLNEAVSKAGLTVNGRPITVFTKTDDSGFNFEAMLPLTAAPEGKLDLIEGVEIGASPSGKALKFQHHGAYEEIEATYEAIAAYLDEKGLDSKDLIIEEYVGELREDDENIDVDIYVFLK